MSPDPFATFDPTPYTSVPNLPLPSTIRLAKNLRGALPDDAPAKVEKLHKLLGEIVTEAEAALIIRLREQNEGGSDDVALDNAVDALWSLLRQRVRGWLAYAREGLAFLDDEPQALAQAGVDLELLRDRGRRGLELAKLLFGADGLKMLLMRFDDQAEAMATVHGLIDTDGLEDEVLELGGEELLPLLRLCQDRYEAMVQARAMRDSGSSADLRELRYRLQRLIVRYNGAVMTMLDEDEPETLAVVEAALQPMITIRLERDGASNKADADAESDAHSEAEAQGEADTDEGSPGPDEPAA